MCQRLCRYWSSVTFRRTLVIVCANERSNLAFEMPVGVTFADMLSTRRCIRNVNQTRDLRLPSAVVTSSPIPRHTLQKDSASQKRCALLSHVALILIPAQTPCRCSQPTGKPMHRVHSAPAIEPGVGSEVLYDATSQATYGNHQSLP